MFFYSLDILISSTDIDHDVAKKIVERCVATRPDLLSENQQIMIKKQGVGLRPCRKGGVRIAAEWTITSMCI